MCQLGSLIGYKIILQMCYMTSLVQYALISAPDLQVVQGSTNSYQGLHQGQVKHSIMCVSASYGYQLFGIHLRACFITLFVVLVL